MSRKFISGRIPHAMLISGKLGFGSLELGLKLSQLLLCQNPSEMGACGQCDSCHRSTKYIHPDLHFGFPVVKKGDKKRADTTSKDFLVDWRSQLNENTFFSEREWNGKMKSSSRAMNINTLECNEIIQKLGLKSFEGGNKVQVIFLAEYLAKEGNRLLKLIEEPPANTFLILVTQNIEKILNTILSRCQLIQVYPMDDEKLEAEINPGLSEMAKNELLFMAQGDKIVLQDLMSNQSTVNYSEMMLSWFRLSYGMHKKPKDLVQWIDHFHSMPSVDQLNFIDYILKFFRDYNLFLLGDSLKVRLSQEEKSVAEKMKKIIDVNKLDKLSQICDTLYYNLNRNVNSKIELMRTSIEVGEVLRLSSVLS